MDVRKVFEQMKVELKDKWLDYYKANRDWIKIAGLHQKTSFNKVIDGKNTTLYCPESSFIIAVVSSLDNRVSDFIKISGQLTGYCDPKNIVVGLGLQFDPEATLLEQK